MAFCSNCGAQLEDGKKFCSNCGTPVSGSDASAPVREAPPQVEYPVKKVKPKKKSIFKRWWFWVIVVIVVLAIIGGSGSSDTPKKVESSGSTTSTAAPASTPTGKIVFGVGETAEYHDVQITMKGYEESTGTQFVTPGEGKVFVFVNLEIANNSAKEIAVSSMLSFNAYCDDYKLDYSGGALMALDGRKQLDGSIAEGKKMDGYLGLEVPADWQKIEVYFTDNVWSSTKIHFELSR